MSKKRSAEQSSTSVAKRPKPNDVVPESVVSINSARQLHELLSFQQDSISQLRNGIRQFKTFLEAIVYAEDKQSTSDQQNILSEYLQSQTSLQQSSDSNSTTLPSLIQAWSFAVQTNSEALLSAIPAILALLLKTISTLIEFREHGIQICKTVLQTAQLKIIANGVSMQKQKEHIISPCLRLLTEVVSFDGGTLAQKVFASKQFTFDGKFLSRNLSLWKSSSGDANEAKRRPAVRTNALHYVLAAIKFMPGPARSEILKYGNVLRALFEHVRRDPVDILQQTLDTLKTYVMFDSSVPFSVKSQVLNDHNLGFLAMVYREESDRQQAEDQRTDKIVHSFLSLVCSDSRAGVLRSYSGWYPPGTDKDPEDDDEEDDGAAEIDLGLDSVKWYNRYQTKVPVRNTTLSRFSQSLRPHASPLESDLLVKIFEAAPELVADYFFQKSTFAFDPKLTATWIGYSAFLFSTAQLPVPTNFGRKDGLGPIPPPASIVVENILPQPLTKKVLTRCFNQQVELVTFFAVRLTCVAFQKLRSILARFSEAAESEGPLWNDGAVRVLEEFIRRCPSMKDVIATFRQTKPENLLQKEAVLRLIALYYEVAPSAAMEEKFDVSSVLADALKQTDEGSSARDFDHGPPEADQSNLSLLILNHLLQIARRTPDMKWWNKSQTLKLSPFTMLLKMVAKMARERMPEDMFRLLDTITKEYGVLQQDTETPALQALIGSLVHLSETETSDGLEEFIDECFSRLVRKPIKYEDDLDSMASQMGKPGGIGPVSLILMTLLEQWPYVAERTESSSAIAAWLVRYISYSKEIGEDNAILNETLRRMKEMATKKTDRKMFSGQVADLLHQKSQDIRIPEVDIKTSPKKNGVLETEGQQTPLDFATFGPPSEDPKHRGLHRWSSKDIPSAVSEGDLTALILCLSSAFSEVRQLALANLRQFTKNLDATKSTYPDAPQIYLLLGLLINTVSPLIQPRGPMMNGGSHHENGSEGNNSDSPVPYFCTVYAVLALDILQDPLHPLYPKINDFHTRAPKWDIGRLPSYWTHQVVFAPPTTSRTTTAGASSVAPSKLPSATLAPLDPTPTSNGLQGSINKLGPSKISSPHAFLLSYIWHSLRTPADLAILRKRGTLEPLLALANNPFFPRSSGNDVDLEWLLHILARITNITGGSTMLITRKGIVAWLGGVVAPLVSDQSMPKQGQLATKQGVAELTQRVWDTCDREYVDSWGGSMVEETVDGIVQRLEGL